MVDVVVTVPVQQHLDNSYKSDDPKKAELSLIQAYGEHYLKIRADLRGDTLGISLDDLRAALWALGVRLPE